MNNSYSGLLPLLRHFEGVPLALTTQGAVSAGQFVRDATRLAARLPANAFAINICEDRYHFLLGFAAAMMRGQVTLMPSSRAPQVLQDLRAGYADSYCIGDQADHSDQTMVNVTTPPIDAGPHAYAAPMLPADQPAAILFTSGSTGTPTAHAKTWAMLVRGADQLQRAVDAISGCCIVGSVAPQHMFGLESTIAFPLQWGCTIHHARPHLPADIEQAIVESPAPVWLMTTPLHLRACVTDAPRLHNVAGAISATMPLAAEVAREAENMLQAPLYEIYGCTEAGVVATRRTARQTLWQLRPDLYLRRDADARDWLDGPRLAAPLALNDCIEMRGEREFALQGRIGDMIKLAGKRTTLASLDAALQAIPGVSDGAFHRPDNVADGSHDNQRLGAFFVADNLSVAQVREALRAAIDPVFMPRPLVKVARLPRDGNGKLSRAALAALAAGPLQQSGKFPADHPVLAGHFPGKPIVPGVLLLEEVMQLAARRHAVCGVRQVKFHAPLLPDQPYRIAIAEAASGTLKFTIAHGDIAIASGMLQLGQADHA